MMKTPVDNPQQKINPDQKPQREHVLKLEQGSVIAGTPKEDGIHREFRYTGFRVPAVRISSSDALVPASYIYDGNGWGSTLAQAVAKGEPSELLMQKMPIVLVPVQDPDSWRGLFLPRRLHVLPVLPEDEGQHTPSPFCHCQPRRTVKTKLGSVYTHIHTPTERKPPWIVVEEVE